MLFTTIEAKEYNNSMTFENFLDELGFIESGYILEIQSTLKQPMVFLKRKPSQTWINIFAKDMPNLWHANIDAQYALNAYTATHT